MIIGHSVSDGDGVILAIDEPVATVLQRTQKQLVGMSYLSITHPDDVARNLSQVAALQPNGNSARIRKRYIGGEGDIITLEVQVSRLGNGESGRLIGTLCTASYARPTQSAAMACRIIFGAGPRTCSESSVRATRCSGPICSPIMPGRRC